MNRGNPSVDPGGQQSGFTCPQCSELIPVWLQMLLLRKGVVCPNCGLHLAVDMEASKSAMDELQKLADAFQKVEQSKGTGR